MCEKVVTKLNLIQNYIVTIEKQQMAKLSKSQAIRPHKLYCLDKDLFSSALQTLAAKSRSVTIKHRLEVVVSK